MPNREQTQDQGTIGRNPAAIPSDDEETVEGDDELQAQDEPIGERDQVASTTESEEIESEETDEDEDEDEDDDEDEDALE